MVTGWGGSAEKPKTRPPLPAPCTWRSDRECQHTGRKWAGSSERCKARALCLFTGGGVSGRFLESEPGGGGRVDGVGDGLGEEGCLGDVNSVGKLRRW